ncbi:unnamed protein product [Calypogeia fissa]
MARRSWMDGDDGLDVCAHTMTLPIKHPKDFMWFETSDHFGRFGKWAGEARWMATMEADGGDNGADGDDWLDRDNGG